MWVLCIRILTGTASSGVYTANDEAKSPAAAEHSCRLSDDKQTGQLLVRAFRRGQAVCARLLWSGLGRSVAVAVAVCLRCLLLSSILGLYPSRFKVSRLFVKAGDKRNSTFVMCLTALLPAVFSIHIGVTRILPYRWICSVSSWSCNRSACMSLFASPQLCIRE